MTRVPGQPPIPTPDEQKFLAHIGVIQWAQAVCRARDRIIAADEANSAAAQMPPRSMHALQDRARWYRERIGQRKTSALAAATERVFFCNAAAKLLVYREWAASLGLFPSLDFSGLDAFNRQDIIDLRNMNEHITEYFGQPDHKGKVGGRDRSRWQVQTARETADASSSIGSLLGNRLDFMAYAAAVESLLPALLAEPTLDMPMPA